MSPAVISITSVAYFIILFTISYIAGRKAVNEGYFVGNRKSAWYIVACTIPGTETKVTPEMVEPIMAKATIYQADLRFPTKNPSLSALRPAI